MEKHPKGLYVLFATEMWERFGFYSMLALFTLYLRDPEQGFGMTKAEATTLYSNYLMFVYASPMIGGWIADRMLGFRRSVLVGGAIFMVGYYLLSIRDMTAVYAGLTCLVVGNGFFKPNVSAMVGNLYPTTSKLKDSAYNLFYLGINLGAFIAPLCMEFIKTRWGYGPGFATAAAGMVISIVVLWTLARHTEAHDGSRPAPGAPAPVPQAIDQVPESTRILALIAVYFIVIVFWMVFHQNGSTMTYWGNDNTDWNVSGTFSNAINPFWVLVLSIPVVRFWSMLRRKGKEPSIPTKMTIGMVLTALAFTVLAIAALVGEAAAPEGQPYAYKVSPAWLVGCYGVLTLGELMLSPMGLALISKVAPYRLRGRMMGGWFLATATGNKLTQIGVFWDRWLHSTFWFVLAALALGMALVVFTLRPRLQKAMPGC